MTTTRYNGPLTVIRIDPDDPMNFMNEMIFAYAPPEESWRDSTRRLIDAIREVGETELRPTTIWLAYRRRKDLQELIK